MSNSGRAICEQSRSKKRYAHKDRLLKGFVEFGGYWTCKEMAGKVGFEGEAFFNSPKRVAELVKAGLVDVGGDRECGVTGMVVMTYGANDKALPYLLDKGIGVKRVEVVPVVDPVPVAGRVGGFAGIRGLLG